MRITDPIIELLAIKLYEHDTFSYAPKGKTWPSDRPCWRLVCDEDRDVYRDMARGAESLYDDSDSSE
jgi:hypothetical protein